jgi:hypothetical protein
MHGRKDRKKNLPFQEIRSNLFGEEGISTYAFI